MLMCVLNTIRTIPTSSKRIVVRAKPIYSFQDRYSESKTYLQFPRSLRSSYTDYGREFLADVVEVIREDGVRKYYRAMNKSIREAGSDEVIA